jgi:hypothetical protein
MTNDFYKIEIEGRQFKSAYLVYLIKLSSDIHGQYFYVGQTGDRNYLSARPAFRRLAGHLSDHGNSTENQIYRQIAIKILGIESAKEKRPFDNVIKDAVTTFLINCKIEMFVHPIADFLSSPDLDSHKINRQWTEKIENELINYLIGKFGAEKILNKKFTRIDSSTFDKLTIDIIDHFDTNYNE